MKTKVEKEVASLINRFLEIYSYSSDENSHKMEVIETIKNHVKKKIDILQNMSIKGIDTENAIIFQKQIFDFLNTYKLV